MCNYAWPRLTETFIAIMKILIAIFLLNAITLARTASAPDVKGFEDGKKYIYEFKARSGTGIQGEKTQFSGFGLQCHMAIHKTGSLLAFHMFNMKYGSFNKKLDNVLDEVEIDYNRLSTENQEYNVNLLEQAFWVELDEGVFKAIYFNRNEDIAKHNNKKSIAALFQLDLRREGRDDLHSYVSHENNWDGVCDTAYIIGHHHDNHKPNVDVLNVTKIRNYSNCTVQPHLFHSSVMGYKNQKSENEYTQAIKDYSEVQYNLKGTRDHYVIERINSATGFTVSPFTVNGQTIISMVNQTMTLLEIVDVSEIPSPPADMDKHTALYHEFNNDKINYNEKSLNAAHYYNRVFKTKRDDRLAKVESLYLELQKAVTSHETKTHHFIPRFVEEFQKFNFEDFDIFFSQKVFIEPMDTNSTAAQSFVTQLLPYVGTNPAISFIFHSFKVKKIDYKTATDIIQKIPFYAKEPSKKLLDAVAEFRKSVSRVNEEKGLFISTLLAYGTLLYRGCQSDTFNPHPVDAKQYIPREDCTQHIQELVKEYHAETELKWKVLYLRAIINTEDVFELALSIIKSDEHDFLRQNAMWSIMDEAYGPRAHLIPQILFPVFLNPEEDYITRLHAFCVLMFTKPTPELFGKVFVILSSDPSHKLRSVIYSTLSAYANSTVPETQNFQEMATHTLKYAEQYHRFTNAEPVFKFNSVYDAKYNYGRSSLFTMLADGKSAMPRDIFGYQSINLFGYSFGLLEIMFASSGAPFHEEYLAALGLAPKGLLPEFSPVENELVLKTIQKFKLKSGFQRNGAMQFYYKLFHKDVFVDDDFGQFFSGISNTISTGVSYKYKDGEAATNFNINTVKYATVELIRPNGLGMPVFLKLDIPAANYVHGSSKQNLSFDDSDVETDVHLGWDISIRSQVYVYSILFGNLGFELQTDLGVHLPLKGSFGYDSNTTKIDIKYIPSLEPYDVFYYKTTPKTFSAYNLPIEYSSETTQKTIDVGHEYFGAGLTFNMSYDNYFQGSYRKFFKSFFKTSKTDDDYSSTSEKIQSGITKLITYSLLNPTARPFSLNVRFSRCTDNPTNEFHLTSGVSLSERDFGNFKIPAVAGHRLWGSLSTKGPIERAWEFMVSASCRWPQLDNPKIIASFKRTAISCYDKDPFEVCINNKLHMSDDYEEIFHHQPVDIKVVSTTQMSWGKSCQDPDSNVTLQIILEKSDEQKNLDSSKLPFYKKCKQLVSKGNVLNLACWKMILDLGRLDKYTHILDTNFHPIKSKAASTLFKRLTLFLRHKLYDNLRLDYFTGSHVPNHIESITNLSYHHPDIFDMKVIHPDETAYYNNVYKPNNEPVNVAEQWTDKLARKVYNYHRPICIITGNYVRTFDGLTYESPLKGCHYLAFSEPYWNKTFVYYRAVNTKQFNKAVKFYLNHHVIDFIPNDETIDVTVDGQPVLQGDIYSYYYPSQDDRKYSDFLEIFKSGNEYTLISKHFGLRFYYNGRDSYIKASTFYCGKQRGLCGNMDGEPNNEFEGPDGHVYGDGVAFAASYAVEDKCD